MPKTWFITGASRGFGKEWSIAALERGDTVAATARNPESLDDLVAQFGVPVPNHIKIDVDGIESEILAGAAATLKDPALRSILVELSRNNKDDSEAIDRVLAAGFKLWNVQEKPRNAFVNYAEHANYIFVRE